MEDVRSYKSQIKVDNKAANIFKRNFFFSSEPISKAWPMKFGNDLYAFMGSAGAFHIMHYFRKQLKIRPHGKMTCYGPTVLLAGAFTDMIHSYLVDPEIIEGTSCTSCITMKSALIQGTVYVYPLILSPLIGFYLADKLLTYPVPSLTQAPKEVFGLWSKMIQKNSRAFLISVGIQMIGAAFVTFKKQECIWNFKNEQ